MHRPILYWLITVFFLIWGIAYAGLVIFSFVIAGDDHWATLVNEGRIKAEYAQYIMDIPNWVIMITAIAAGTRLLGGIGLIMKQSWALPVYGISLLVVAFLMARGFLFADVASVIRPSQLIVEMGFLALSVAAVWFAWVQRANGILR